MTIPIIHTKKNLQSLAFISSVGCFLLIVGIGFVMRELQFVINLQIVQSVIVFLVICQFIYLIHIAYHKKFSQVGHVKINNDYFSVFHNKSDKPFLIKEISEIKLFIKNYDQLEKKNIFGEYANKSGNYIVFSFQNETKVYELFFSDTEVIDNLIYYLEKNSADKKIEIRNH